MNWTYGPVEPEETVHAVRTFVDEVERYANGQADRPFNFGGIILDELEAVTVELFDRHPVTNLLVALSEEGA